MGLNPWTDIEYFGSPSSPKNKAFRDQDNSNKHKSILGVFLTLEEARESEKELHHKYDVDKNPLFANQAKLSSNGFGTSGPHTPQHRKNISKGKKGKTHTLKSRQKMSNSHKGKKHTLQHCQNLSKANKGKKRTPQQRQRISKSRRDKFGGENHPRFDSTLRDWINIKTAQKELGITTFKLRTIYNLNQGCTNYVVKGKLKQHKGWRLMTDDESKAARAALK